jgi:pimeloyl-ACP methyl ester carboxylesterase
MAMYDERLGSWPVPLETSVVSTRYGDTHVITAGDPASPPLVVLPPMGVAGVSWASSIAALSEQHRVYVLDTIGDVGRSELRNPRTFPRTGRHYSGWMDDVYDELNLSRTDILGGSMGGWIAMHRAIEAPERVRRLVLTGPMGLPSWSATAKALGPMMATALLPSEARRERFLDRTLGDGERVNSELRPWMRLLATCRPRTGAPFTIAGRKLRSIEAPTLIVLGAKDGLVGDAESAATRARRYIADFEIEIRPEAGHAMSVDEPELVGRRIVHFLGSNR